MSFKKSVFFTAFCWSALSTAAEKAVDEKQNTECEHKSCKGRKYKLGCCEQEGPH